VSPGVPPIEIHDAVKARLRDLGAEPVLLGFTDGGAPPFPGVCAVSVGPIAVHGVPSKTPLEPGETVSIDLAAELGGWIADACRSVVVPGGACERADRVVRAAHAVLESGLSAMGPGVHWSAVARAMRGSADDLGVRLIGGIAGHGIGRELHEPPVAWIASDGEEFRLEPGMVLTLEPVVAVGSARLVEIGDGWSMAVRTGAQSAGEERTVAVTADGVRVLTGPAGPGFGQEGASRSGSGG